MLKLFKKKNKKKFVFYGVQLIDNQQSFLTITETQQEALEYINRYLYLKHKEEYETWAYYQKLPVEDMETWAKFKLTRIDQAELANIGLTCIRYSSKDIATMLRMFCGVKPIGCSFDDQLEYSKFLYQESAKESLESLFKQLFPEANMDEMLDETQENNDDNLVQ